MEIQDNNYDWGHRDKRKINLDQKIYNSAFDEKPIKNDSPQNLTAKSSLYEGYDPTAKSLTFYVLVSIFFTFIITVFLVMVILIKNPQLLSGPYNLTVSFLKFLEG